MGSPRALSIARTAERFGQSPATTYLGIPDRVLATMVDEALALRLAADDARLALLAGGKAPGIRPDERYATDDDYGDADELPRGTA